MATLPGHAPIGIAATPTQVLVSDYLCQNIFSVSTSGTVTPFSTLPSQAGLNGVTTCETYLAISPGLGGFPVGNVYATQGHNIYVIPPTGGAPTLFASLPTPTMYDNAHVSITFDTVGTFGNQMIITAFASAAESPTAVYIVNRFGGVSQLIVTGAGTTNGEVSTSLEGPEVAPLSLPLYGGYLFAAAEHAGGIYAISPSGALSPLIVVPGGPEIVRFVPTASSSGGSNCNSNNNNWWSSSWGNDDGDCDSDDNNCQCPQTCTFGNNLEYFQADIQAQKVVAYSSSQLAKFAGSALVPDENSQNIWAVSFSASGPTVSLFAVDTNAIAPFWHEGAAMVHCPPQTQCQCQCSKCQQGDHQHCQNTKCQDQQCKQQQCQQQCQCPCLKCQQGDHQHCQNTQCHDQHCH